MLRSTEEAIVWLRSMKPIWEQVAKHDRNLARQMRDSAASVVGNLAEGERRGGGHERERFGTAYGAAGELDKREGCDLLGVAQGEVEPREYLFGYYAEPDTPQFKIMVRYRQWKYIYMANGGREQLFDVESDPGEIQQLLERRPDEARHLRQAAVAALDNSAGAAALDGSDLKILPYAARQLRRIYQFDRSRGVEGFPDSPQDLLV